MKKFLLLLLIGTLYFAGCKKKGENTIWKIPPLNLHNTAWQAYGEYPYSKVIFEIAFYEDSNGTAFLDPGNPSDTINFTWDSEIESESKSSRKYKITLRYPPKTNMPFFGNGHVGYCEWSGNPDGSGQYGSLRIMGYECVRKNK